jgi:hypothetical protein
VVKLDAANVGAGGGRRPRAPADRRAARCARRASGAAAGVTLLFAHADCPTSVLAPRIMHVTDWFTTILHAAGLSEPTDRVIDGVNQLEWLTGDADASQREGYIYWMGPQMYGVKWRNFKLVLVAQKYTQDAAGEAADSPPHQPRHRPAGTRAGQPAVPALVGRNPLQQAHRRVRGERPSRTTDPDGRAARPRRKSERLLIVSPLSCARISRARARSGSILTLTAIGVSSPRPFEPLQRKPYRWLSSFDFEHSGYSRR